MPFVVRSQDFNISTRGLVFYGLVPANGSKLHTCCKHVLNREPCVWISVQTVKWVRPNRRRRLGALYPWALIVLLWGEEKSTFSPNLYWQEGKCQTLRWEMSKDGKSVLGHAAVPDRCCETSIQVHFHHKNVRWQAKPAPHAYLRFVQTTQNVSNDVYFWHLRLYASRCDLFSKKRQIINKCDFFFALCRIALLYNCSCQGVKRRRVCHLLTSAWSF